MKPQTYRRFIVCLTLVLVGILLAASTVLADTVSVEMNQPTAGQVFIPGDTIIISGTATGLNEITVSVYNSATALIYSAQPAVNAGTFTTQFTLQSNAIEGSYRLRIGGLGLAAPCERLFQVQQSSPMPSVTLTQPALNQIFNPGNTVNISGTAVNLSEVTITVINSASATIYSAQPAVSDGQFSSNFVLNGDALTGAYTIRIGGAGLGKAIEHSFQVQPSGTSSGDDNCFIATAAFGSKFQPSVVLLRQFRDQFLLSNDPGKALVSYYYKNSPPIASYINGNENLKAVVRILLTPLVAIAYLLLHPHLLSLLLIILAAGLVLRRKKRKGNLISIG